MDHQEHLVINVLSKNPLPIWLVLQYLVDCSWLLYTSHSIQPTPLLILYSSYSPPHYIWWPEISGNPTAACQLHS